MLRLSKIIHEIFIKFLVFSQICAHASASHLSQPLFHVHILFIFLLKIVQLVLIPHSFSAHIITA